MANVGRGSYAGVARTCPPPSSIQVLYAQLKPCLESGNERTRLAVAAKIALQIADSTGGSAGSPSPVGEFCVFLKCTSISGGASLIRTCGYWWKFVCTARPPSIVISAIRWLIASITEPCT